MRALPLVATPLLVVSSLSGARADPCGMVPPIWTGTGPAIMRVGGISAYRELRPFFIGLIVGFYLGVGVSYLIDVIWFFGIGHPILHG